MSKIVSTYIKYKKKRTEIKFRQKLELERELEPYLAEFGEAVNEAQAAGKRIEDVEYEIGARNRNLVYTAKRLAKGVKPDNVPATPARQPEPSQPPQERAWDTKFNAPASGYEVWIDGKYNSMVRVTDDGIEIPDEWAVDTDHAALYREVIAHIRALADSGEQPDINI